jgi:hypothetical protein
VRYNLQNALQNTEPALDDAVDQSADVLRNVLGRRTRRLQARLYPSDHEADHGQRGNQKRTHGQRAQLKAKGARDRVHDVKLWHFVHLEVFLLGLVLGKVPHGHRTADDHDDEPVEKGHGPEEHENVDNLEP